MILCNEFLGSLVWDSSCLS